MFLFRFMSEVITAKTSVSMFFHYQPLLQDSKGLQWLQFSAIFSSWGLRLCIRLAELGRHSDWINLCNQSTAKLVSQRGFEHAVVFPTSLKTADCFYLFDSIRRMYVSRHGWYHKYLVINLFIQIVSFLQTFVIINHLRYLWEIFSSRLRIFSSRHVAHPPGFIPNQSGS